MSASRFVLFSAVVVLLCAVSLSEGMRVGPKRCCFSFSDRPLPAKQAVEYSMTSQQCSLQAVLIKTVRGRQVCARPTESWVKDLMKTIDLKLVGRQGNI